MAGLVTVAGDCLRFGANAPSRYLVRRLRESPDVENEALIAELAERWPETVRHLSPLQAQARWTLQAKRALAGGREMPAWREGEHPEQVETGTGQRELAL